MSNSIIAQLKFTWDESTTAATPRGWCLLNGSPVGFYLDYVTHGEWYRETTKTILADTYILHAADGSKYHQAIKNAWFSTIDEAKAFIEASVSEYLERIRA